jgi:hypothetical protein
LYRGVEYISKTDFVVLYSVIKQLGRTGVFPATTLISHSSSLSNYFTLHFTFASGHYICFMYFIDMYQKVPKTPFSPFRYVLLQEVKKKKGVGGERVYLPPDLPLFTPKQTTKFTFEAGTSF